MRAKGRAALTMRRSQGNTFSIHHWAMSGNPSSRSVSPVGAQSTTRTSKRPLSVWRLIWSIENSSSMPGGTVSSSARICSTPRLASSFAIQSWTAVQLASISSWARTSCPQRFVPAGVG